MNSAITFEEFLATSSAEIALTGFLIKLLITAGLSLAVGFLYVRYGRSLSNRSAFAKNFLILGTTIMVIITIVKSSLALSLGLVGALSIVRYRTAIKEPEELAYTFLTIAIGLGLGADQILITTAAFAMIAALIVLRRYFDSEPSGTDYANLRVVTSGVSTTAEITKKIEEYASELRVTRVDETADQVEILYGVTFSNLEDLSATQAAIREADPKCEISYFERIGGF